MVSRRPGGHSRTVLYLVMTLAVAAVIEAAAVLSVSYLSGKGLVFYSPDKKAVRYDEYMKTRDPDTGWPFKRDGQGVDPSGARTSPANDALQGARPCVSVYGDSFTWSMGVDDEHAWPNLLAREMGCPVLNFGVVGFGTDQALIRFENNPHDDAPVAILCFWTEDILRNVNQYRALLSPRSEMLLKPRFVVENGELVKIPLPELSREEYSRMLDTPGKYLAHEYFLPDTHNFTTQPRFPYTLSALKALLSSRVSDHLRGRLFYEDFFGKDHVSGAYAVTLGVMVRFARACEARGKTPLILFIPGCRDIKQRVETGTWIYGGLIKDLEKDRIRVVNAGEIFLPRLGGEDPCAKYRDATLHYNEAGYALIADSVREALARAGIP